MGRKIAAVLIGIVVAFSVVFVVELIPSRLYPPPSGLDFTQADVVANYMRSLPVAAFLWVLCGFILGAFIGGWVCARIARARPYLYAGVIGTVVLAATIANLVMIPHPIWFSLTAIVLIIAATFLAGRLADAQRKLR